MRNWTIQSACALGREKYASLCTSNEEQPDGLERLTMLRFVDNQSAPKVFHLSGENVRVCRFEKSSDNVGVLSTDGKVELFSFSGTNLGIEDIAGAVAGGRQVPDRGFINSIEFIGDRVFACGMGCQIYEREMPKKWKLISNSIENFESSDLWFFNIQGRARFDLFAAGLSNGIHAFDGKLWRYIEVDKDVNVGEMAFLDNGQVCLAGSNSSLYFFSANRKVRKIDLKKEIIINTICFFERNILIGAMNGLYILDLASLSIKDITPDVLCEVVRIESVQGVLWVYGTEMVMKYDGAKWEHFDNINK